MAFIKTTIEVGDRIKLTRQVDSFEGYFEPGTIVTVVNIGYRGYDIIDDKGNRIVECGWNIGNRI